MTQLILLPLALLAGFFLQRARLFPPGSHKVLNIYIIWVAFPAVVLTQMPLLLSSVEFSAALLAPLLGAWIAFLLSTLAILLLAKTFAWTRSTTGALILTAGLGNTSFVGFPVIEALLGKEGLRYALILDQAGSFLLLSTAGILIASLYSGKKVNGANVVKGIVTFPPFVALVGGAALAMTPALSYLTPALERLGATLAPLALVSVGCQLHVPAGTFKQRWRTLACGLAVKLLLIPLAFWLAFRFSGCGDLPCRVTLLEVAMGPMITAAILASTFQLDEELANLMVGVGTPISLLTVWLWNSLL